MQVGGITGWIVAHFCGHHCRGGTSWPPLVELQGFRLVNELAIPSHLPDGDEGWPLRGHPFGPEVTPSPMKS